MVREFVSSLNLTQYAECALILFAVAFCVIVIHAIRLPRAIADKFAAIPLTGTAEEDSDE